MVGERGVVDPQQFRIVGRARVGPDLHPRHRGPRVRGSTQGTSHLQQFTHRDQTERGGGRPGGLERAVRPEPVAAGGLGHRRASHRRPDAAPTGPRVHHEFRHSRTTVPWRGQIEIADDRADRAGCGARFGTGYQQMLGAVVDEFTQNLFADRGHSIEFGCRRDEFAHLLLLFGGECGAPLR